MMLTKTVKADKTDFSSVFLEIEHEQKLELGNNQEFRFFMLDIQNNQYSYYQMFTKKDTDGKASAQRRTARHLLKRHQARAVLVRFFLCGNHDGLTQGRNLRTQMERYKFP